MEPHPGTFQFLERNIAVNRDEPETCPHVDALNLAAAPERATLHLRLNPENRGDNRLYQGTYQGRIEQWETLPIQAVPVDEALAELGIQEVNFVKIDIQGYEEKAIRGFQQTLARSENILLMSEFWPKGLREAGGSAETYLAMLCDLGFWLYELKEKPRGALQPLGVWQAFIQCLPGRKYTNIVGVKGADLVRMVT